MVARLELLCCSVLCLLLVSFRRSYPFDHASFVLNCYVFVFISSRSIRHLLTAQEAMSTGNNDYCYSGGAYATIVLCRNVYNKC